MKTTAKESAQNFVAACKEYGFSWEFGHVYTETCTRVTIRKDIVIGDKASFCDADMSYYSIFQHATGKGGSVWGTDGGSIGGMVAMNSGKFVMHKSGLNKSFVKALAALA